MDKPHIVREISRVCMGLQNTTTQANIPPMEDELVRLCKQYLGIVPVYVEAAEFYFRNAKTDDAVQVLDLFALTKSEDE